MVKQKKMTTYLFTIYLKYSRSQRFSAKVFEVRSLISAESKQEAIAEGLNRSAQLLGSYFTDDAGYNAANDLLDNFDLTSGMEEMKGVSDHKLTEIFDSGKFRTSETYSNIQDKNIELRERLSKKWNL